MEVCFIRSIPTFSTKPLSSLDISRSELKSGLRRIRRILPSNYGLSRIAPPLSVDPFFKLITSILLHSRAPFRRQRSSYRRQQKGKSDWRLEWRGRRNGQKRHEARVAKIKKLFFPLWIIIAYFLLAKNFLIL